MIQKPQYVQRMKSLRKWKSKGHNQDSYNEVKKDNITQRILQGITTRPWQYRFGDLYKKIEYDIS